MKNVKKLLLVLGGVSVVTGVAIALKKLYNEYRDFADFDVKDIISEDDEVEEDIEDENEYEDEDDIWDEDSEEEICEEELFEDWDTENEEKDEYSCVDDEEPYEKTDFEKVFGVTRDKAIDFIVSCNKDYSKELLVMLKDASLAEIYSSLK